MGLNASLRASSRTLKLLLISSIFGSSWQKTPSIRPSMRKRYPSLSNRQLAGTSALYRGSTFTLFFCTRTWISWPSAAERPYPECASMLPLRGTGNAKSDSAMDIDFFTMCRPSCLARFGSRESSLHMHVTHPALLIELTAECCHTTIRSLSQKDDFVQGNCQSLFKRRESQSSFNSCLKRMLGLKVRILRAVIVMASPV